MEKKVIQNQRPSDEARFEKVNPTYSTKPKLDVSEFPQFDQSSPKRDFNKSLEEELNFTFTQSSVDPSSLFDDGYELQDQSIIPNENLDGTFLPEENQIEFFVYDIDKNLLSSEYKFEDWNITTNTSTKTLTSTDTVQLYPAKNLYDRGYDVGNLYALYNFINLELNSSNSNPYFISDISSDRTEIRIKSNFISNEEIESSFNILKTKVDSKDYFDEFYISFGDNEYHIGVNIELEAENNQDSILIKLYDGLPEQYKVKDELYIATKVAETQSFRVEFEEILPASFDDVQYLQGPNTNLDLKDVVNNSTVLKSQDDIQNTNSSESRFNLSNILNQKGVKITPNYSYDTYDEFVKFSSAKKRVENFYYKVQQIESYKTDLATLDSLTVYDTVNADKVTINNNIENIIKNFDGYEYYLYYNDSAFAYPKSGSQYPYPLLNSTSSEVLNWLGSDVEGSSYYGGIILSASFYDNKNQDQLLYTIPEFIRTNSDNDNYIDFSHMAGQHFDELWLYTRAVAEKSNTTNTLDEGIPLKLAEEGIKSLGFKGVGNNFNNQDGYIGLTGEDNGSYVPPTGSEDITNYIAINEGNVTNYFVDDYVDPSYAETEGGIGFPYAIDRVSKEIYKRLYHNMAYLVKKKGTISGLRQLINIWGIPNTILRINEFGGKDKDHSDDYDLWFKRYSYAYKPISNRNVASSSVLFPWMPLERNRIADSKYIVPDNIQFRFKSTGYPSSSFAGGFFSQSLAVKKSDGDPTSTNFDFGVGLFYEEVATGSYLGADSSEYANWGKMRFYISGAAADGGTAVSNDIYLPFFDKGWWSVMLQRNQHVSASDNSNATTYTLYAKNKIYNGADGDMIGFEGSASIVSNVSTSINEAWNKFGTTSDDGIYLGGFVEGANVGGVILNEQGKIFSGSLQEFRYYSNDIPEATFNDFVMNPRSIEGNSITGVESSFDIVNFRAPLGNELEAIFTSSISSAHTDTFTSVHPAVSGKASNIITGSFINPSTSVTSSDYSLIYYDNNTAQNFSEAIRETYFLDQPAVGIRNRISNKIQVRDSQSYGTVLSSQRSLEQEYEINEDFTENINSLEVAFSPQDDINDDIIDSFGYGVIADALADPRNLSQSLDYYPELRETAEDYFKKYSKGNIYDYIRLIKYIDNSLFKAIKNYVPARTSVTTGIVIKQHMLERNRYRQPSISFSDLEITGGLEIDPIDGGTGGSVEKFNYSGSPEFGQTLVTQSYNNTFDTVVGLQTIVEDTQKEFYDGEYSGSEFVATTQSLFNNPYKISYSEEEKPYPTSSIEFSNSDYNALLNNYNANRENTWLFDVDYSQTASSPDNLNLIISGSAIKAQTPDSNYTARRVTYPRYEGSRVSSADYNLYTSASSPTFLNGDTGSWDGDKSYGNTAVVDKHPIYMAHFQSSYNNYTLWNTVEYELDSLIEIPFDNVLGVKDFEPKTIKISGDNTYLKYVNSALEVGRKTGVAYNSLTYDRIDYSTIKNEPFLIKESGIEYTPLLSNQISNTTESANISFERFNNVTEFAMTSSTFPLLTVSSVGSAFLLKGPPTKGTIEGFIDNDLFLFDKDGSYFSLSGSLLETIHTYNQCLLNQDIAFTSSVLGNPKSIDMGVEQGLDNTDPNNYINFVPTSTLSSYKDEREPFLLQRGDEIRVQYTLTTGTGDDFRSEDVIQDFTVTDVPKNSSQSGGSTPTLFARFNGVGYNNAASPGGVNFKNLYNRIEVTPDPSSLSIPSGEIYRVTFRRRKQQDSKVLLLQSSPSGSNGVLNKSGGGYLIPTDLSETQKINALTIINQLKGKNAFRNDDTTPPT